MAYRDFQEEQNRYGRQSHRGRSDQFRSRGQQSEWDGERGQSRFGGREEDAWRSRDEEYGRDRPRDGDEGRGWSDTEGDYGQRGPHSSQRAGASIGGYGGGGGAYRGEGGRGTRGEYAGGAYGGDRDDWGYDREQRRSPSGGRGFGFGGQSGYGGDWVGRGQSGYGRGASGQGDYGFGERSGAGYGDDEAGGYEEFGEYRGGRGGAWRGGTAQSRFGGERARGVQGLFAGRGPKGYQRSDDRIREDVCDRLMDEAHLDASNLTVAVAGGEVTLEGTVDSKDAKRRAEDVAEDVSGVREVTNRLRVERHVTVSGPYGETSGTPTGAPGTAGIPGMSGTSSGAQTKKAS